MRSGLLPSIGGAMACAGIATGATFVPVNDAPAALGTSAVISDMTAERGTFSAMFQSLAVGIGFDTLGVRIYDGHAFGEPAFRSFSSFDWKTSFQNNTDLPAVAAAEGPLIQGLQYRVVFDAPRTESWIFDIVLFKEREQLITTRFEYGGNELFTFVANGILTDVTYCDFAACEVVPLPGSGAISLAGVGILAGRRRRRVDAA